MNNIQLLADLVLGGNISINQLQEASDNGTLSMDITVLSQKIEMKKREQYLQQHPYEIYQGKDGNWYTYFPDAEKGRRRLKRKKRIDIENAVIDYYKQESDNPTIREIFDEWNDRRLRNDQIKPSTHMRNQQLFSRCYSDFGQKRIKSITSVDLSDFLEDQIYEKKLTAKAFSNLKSITIGFLRRAKKRGLIQFNINDFLDDLDISGSSFKKTSKDDSKEVFSTSELPILIEYLTENPDIHNLGILLMLVTGVRVGELVALKYEDFDNATTFHIHSTETRFQDSKGKNHREISSTPKTAAGNRIVYIPADYAWIYKQIRHINPFTEYLFVNNGKRMSTDAIRKRMYRVCKKIGIPPRSPHKARKTCATIMLDNHIPEKVIIGQLGHTNISCTEQYYYRDRKSDDEKKSLINAIPEFKAN